MQTLLEAIEPYRHIIWDWNGTLVNDAPHARDIVNLMLQEQQLPELTLEQYKDAFCHPVIDFYKGLGLDCSEKGFATICEVFNLEYNLRRPSISVHQNALTIARQISSSTRTQSILSAYAEHLLLEHTRMLGITDYFDNICGLGDLGAASKIARGKALLELSGIPAQDTIIVGDTDHDWETAQELGTGIVLIAQGHQSQARLNKLHPNTLASLTAL